MMNCSKVQENLSAFLDNELTASDMTAIKAHLIRCSECRQERDRLEKIGSSLRSLPPLQVPPEFEYQLFARIKSQTTQIGSKRLINWKTVLVPICTLVLGIIISPLLIPNSDSPTTVAETP
ncbi:zf-HC2 domain-containing protein, partial [bacterium]|nr:zf-HC2 domain-containing protein [candidate division CSSED10-310 bacterium]